MAWLKAALAMVFCLAAIVAAMVAAAAVIHAAVR